MPEPTTVPDRATTGLDRSVPPGVVALQPAEHDWQTLPAAPLAPRVSPAVVVAGDEVVVWGGAVPNALDGSEPPFADGAVLDLASGTWRKMSLSPLQAGPATGASFNGLATIVDAQGSAATYDPVAATWTTIEGPGVALSQIVVWGDQLIGTTGEQVVRRGTSGWEPMPATDPDVQSAQLVVAAERLFLVDSGSLERIYELVDDSWQRLPTGPLADISGVMVGAGAVNDRLVVVEWTMRAFAFDPATATWERLPDVPGLSYKCQPQVVDVGGTVVMSGCGFVAALGDGDTHWTTSTPFAGAIDLGLHTTANALIAGTSIVEGNPAGVLLSPIQIGGLAIDPVAAPAGFRGSGSWIEGDQKVTINLLASGCAVSVSRAQVEQITLASAFVAATAEPLPASVEWGGFMGSFELACPDRAGYELALSALRTAGERTTAIDATDEILSLGVQPAPTPEGLIESIWPLLEQRFTDGDQQPQIGLTWYPDNPATATIEVLGLADDSVMGVAYTIVGRSTDRGWEVERERGQHLRSRRHRRPAVRVTGPPPRPTRAYARLDVTTSCGCPRSVRAGAGRVRYDRPGRHCSPVRRSTR